MEINELQNQERRSVGISLRTYPSYSLWLKEKSISPSRIFNKAVEELMEKEKQEDETQTSEED